MYQQISSNLSSDEKLNRLQKQALLNISHHMARLSLLTENFSLEVCNFDFGGVERDYLVSLLYSINENLAVLNFAGAKELLDAFFLNMLDGRAWYDEAINVVHKSMVESSEISEDMEDFEVMLNTLNPPPEQAPLPDELGDDEPIEGEQKGLEDIDGNPEVEYSGEELNGDE